MVWSTIPTVTPQDTLTAAWLNTYLRDNQLETLAGPARVGPSLGVADGPHAASFHPIAWANKTSTSTTSSTTPVDVGPTVGLAGIEHSGIIVVHVSAEIANSATSFTQYGVGTTGGGLVGLSSAVRSSTSDHIALSSHVIHWNVPSPVSLTGYLWTNNGATTASVYNSRITVWAL